VSMNARKTSTWPVTSVRVERYVTALRGSVPRIRTTTRTGRGTLAANNATGLTNEELPLQPNDDAITVKDIDEWEWVEKGD